MNAITQAAERLSYLCSIIPEKLRYISNAEFQLKPDKSKWSKQEILGHLIDSACNNHQRFVRLQYQQEPVIFYEPDAWVCYNYYLEQDKVQLINLWEAYNKHLAALILKIPDNALQNTGILQNGTKVTLSFFITDYVAHLEYHLRQIIEY